VIIPAGTEFTALFEIPSRERIGSGRQWFLVFRWQGTCRFSTVLTTPCGFRFLGRIGRLRGPAWFIVRSDKYAEAKAILAAMISRELARSRKRQISFRRRRATSKRGG
jgi:hypothetical protein